MMLKEEIKMLKEVLFIFLFNLIKEKQITNYIESTNNKNEPSLIFSSGELIDLLLLLLVLLFESLGLF